MMTTIKRKKKMNRWAGLNFEKFDENIIFNILKRLEADTLYNLRVVSKRWYNVIFDPHFANSNLYYANRGIILQTQLYDSYRLGFIEMKEGGEIIFRDLNMSLKEPVRASCNGLVLMKDFPKRGDLSVGNLLTRKGIKIPPCSSSNFLLGNTFGFTYIPHTREYKIVCQMLDVSIRSYVYMILTLGSNQWRQVSGPQFHLPYDQEPFSINSFVHSLITDDDQVKLFSIDTVDEKSHKTALPGIMETRYHYLMDFGGVLSLVGHSGIQAEVWVLEDFHKKEWIRRHCIILQNVHSGAPIGSLGNGRAILFVNMFENFGSCYVADVELQKAKHRVKQLPFVKANRSHCIPHLNSLMSGCGQVVYLAQNLNSGESWAEAVDEGGHKGRGSNDKVFEALAALHPNSLLPLKLSPSKAPSSLPFQVGLWKFTFVSYICGLVNSVSDTSSYFIFSQRRVPRYRLYILYNHSIGAVSIRWLGAP